VVQDGANRFGGMAAALRVRRQREPELHLARITLQDVNNDVSEKDASAEFHDGRLIPTGLIRVRGPLPCNERAHVLERGRRPALKAGHLRVAAVRKHALCIAHAQGAQEQAVGPDLVAHAGRDDT
jgi:hypothetical protein